MAIGLDTAALAVARGVEAATAGKAAPKESGTPALPMGPDEEVMVEEATPKGRDDKTRVGG